MIKCVILDDELLAISYLKLLCAELNVEVVKAFNNPKVFLQEIHNIDCDLCILDIEMPGMNGLQVAELIKGKHIIFTTAYKEYAAEAFDLDVVDYVRKPIKKERLQQAFEKAEKLIIEKEKNNFFEWNTNLGKTVIFTNEIVYIKTSEIDSRDKDISLKNSSELILKNLSFKHLSELLPQKYFVQINKKEMVNIHHIKVFSSSEIILDRTATDGNPLKLNVSDVFKDQVSEKLTRNY
ncbi:response regulator transcription factor [Epilithonimonas ginsengisoli]|uniref:Response regulator transcription factor n=1 Tax=Epilithonimonas ginsengisoli TaxID=1245592 RepID=A0ABU4JKF7_9FLAO|nr:MULTISPECIES: response regulator transcription factor [Chryseobacterium group]MBV6881109.1 response regulator transcription factor [Epilithonimonas sp. FP105]MDW8550136.1 response regulator transcription factor [Epilithonimonas ginsengisoli]OAH71934.1 two-component system response regulator [Chryseobacterium sp. FP211-J200]